MKKKLDIKKILIEEDKIAKAWEDASSGKSSFIKDGLKQLAVIFHPPKVTVDVRTMKERLEAYEAFCKEVDEREAKNPTPRCEKSGNPCGTDTWMVGWTCPCSSCQRYLETRIVREEE